MPTILVVGLLSTISVVPKAKDIDCYQLALQKDLKKIILRHHKELEGKKIIFGHGNSEEPSSRRTVDLHGNVGE